MGTKVEQKEDSKKRFQELMLKMDMAGFKIDHEVLSFPMVEIVKPIIIKPKHN